ncbi:NAD-dependent epimerase/dehydratase family protein [Patescibacteria group bacterium]|nr:NAD-dependent epimerase/dehydratase family protein [Patescibacteria group bacterium]
MKILITGGAGFIGSHVQDLYLKKGHEVVVVDNLVTGKETNLNPKAKFYLADIRDKVALEQIFDQEKGIEAVNHHAAHASVRESVEDPAYDAENNIVGSLNLAELAHKYKVKKFIFASTGGAIYGDTEMVPTSEKTQAFPESPYGVSKYAFEKYLGYYHLQKKLDFTALRYANVFGARQDPLGEAGVVAIFSKKIWSDEQPIINGDGKQTRDYVYVEDVAQANLLALEKESLNRAINIGTAIETDVNQLFKYLVEISGKEVKEEHSQAKPGEQQRSSLDCSEALALLGWKPKYILGQESGRKALKKTFEFFKN